MIDQRLEAENDTSTLISRSLDGLLVQFEVNAVYCLLASVVGSKKVRRVLVLKLYQKTVERPTDTSVIYPKVNLPL